MRIRQILIVHPSRSVRTLLERIILSDGVDMAVSHADGGEDAVRQLEKAWFDLMIVDPGLTDIALEQSHAIFTSSSKNTELAIIAIAGGDSPADMALVAENGFDHYVLPPIEPDVLNKKINTLCNPRHWRKMGRYHFPDSRVVISVWGMEADARLINISKGGVLVEAAGDRSELFLQNSPKLTVNIRLPDGYVSIDAIPSKLERLNAIEWNAEYKPVVMRMVYIFLPMEPLAQDRLEQILQMGRDAG